MSGKLEFWRRFCNPLIAWRSGSRTLLLIGYNDELRAIEAPGDDFKEGQRFDDAYDVDMLRGLRAMRSALSAARRVIETGRAEREAWVKTCQLADAEELLDDLRDQSSAYARALTEFERLFGRGYPMLEDLTRL